MTALLNVQVRRAKAIRGTPIARNSASRSRRIQRSSRAATSEIPGGAAFSLLAAGRR